MPLPTWPDIQMVKVFSVNEHLADNLTFGASDPPGCGPVADDAGKPIPRLVISVRSVQVRPPIAPRRPDGDRRFPPRLPASFA